MGESSAIAFSSLTLETNVKGQQYLDNTYEGALIVSDKAENTYRLYTAQPSGKHFEVKLIEKLKADFGDNLNQLPNGVSLIFTQAYSPCINCTNEIKNLATLVSRLTDISIKVRFKQYYVKQNGGTDEMRWENEFEAGCEYLTQRIEFGFSDVNKEKAKLQYINMSGDEIRELMAKPRIKNKLDML